MYLGEFHQTSFKMAPRGGFEPPRPEGTWLTAKRVYQFRHLGMFRPWQESFCLPRNFSVVIPIYFGNTISSPGKAT